MCASPIVLSQYVRRVKGGNTTTVQGAHVSKESRPLKRLLHVIAIKNARLLFSLCAASLAIRGRSVIMGFVPLYYRVFLVVVTVRFWQHGDGEVHHWPP